MYKAFCDMCNTELEQPHYRFAGGQAGAVEVAFQLDLCQECTEKVVKAVEDVMKKNVKREEVE